MTEATANDRAGNDTGGAGYIAAAAATPPPPPGKAGGSSEDPRCAICLGDFEEGDCILHLPCTHRFHSSCINELQRAVEHLCQCGDPNCRASIKCEYGNLCPMCRAELPPSVDTLMLDAHTLMKRADKYHGDVVEQRGLMERSMNIRIA